VLNQQPASMGQHAVHSTVSLLLLSVISINISHSINLQGDSSQVLDISDGSGAGSEQVTSIAGVTDTQTETTLIEQSSPESSVAQEQFFSNETFSSVEKLATVPSVTNLQGFSEGNNVSNTKATSPPINSGDMITKEGKNKFLQQTSNENFSSFSEFDDLSKPNNNHTEGDNASFLDSNSSYSVHAGYVTPQRYTGDIYVYSDNNSTIIHDNYHNDSLSGEDKSGEPFDENSFNQLINDGSGVYHDQIADQSDSDMKENQYVNWENYNTSEIQSQAINGSVDDLLLNQEQLDSPTAEFLNNSFDSEDIFEKVFNISVNDIVDNEQKHYFNYQADSKGHERQSPQSATQVSGSNTEQDQADNNENFAFNNVFEVYHYSRKPGPDGAVQNKTLGQHIEELVLSRLPSSDNNKDSDQEESGDHEENNIPLGVEISPDEIDENEDEGTHSGASLAFVFDSTGSMWDDLVQVKMGAERIMATMLELPDKPIYNYVLVPFHDPSK
jgi:hypothetical protein